jgi:RNA polymerase sigma factor (sigma-70 family)
MSSARKLFALRDLDRLLRQGTLPAGDGALLECFLSTGDESAFEAIVARHGSMVLGVCRRVLGDRHDAEDAFQATFLVLIRKARQLSDADRLGPWLYGVATRVATKARAREARRHERYRTVPSDLRSPQNAQEDGLDVRPILDAELGKLPAKLRDILVLCLLEGSTAEEAAHRLSCPLGTVKSRLARGRVKLRSRLTARGLAPAAALAVAAGASQAALASPVSQALSLTTSRMAGLAPDRIPRAVVALTRGVATSMRYKSSVLAAVICGGIALAGAGLASWEKSHASDAETGQGAGGDVTDRAKAESINHMKLIMLAFHNYVDLTGHFPPSGIPGADGQPKLSWRVALLPFLGHQELYESFHLQEPWDSPHNTALIARMPEIFRTPSSPTGPGTTRIRGLEGPGTMFDGNRMLKIQDVTDGLSNTIVVVTAREPVPWTRPGELPAAPGQPLSGLDDADDKGALAGIGDGSVRYVPRGDQALLTKLVTRAGGEVVVWPAVSEIQLQPAPRAIAAEPTPMPTPTAEPRPTATVAPGPASAISPELEARLRTIEQKLDRLLRKLGVTDEPSGTRPER